MGVPRDPTREVAGSLQREGGSQGAQDKEAACGEEVRKRRK